jgi:MGT family glycosyltransferase
MARFLFTVWPFPGHFYPDIAIAHALRERGHQSAFYTGARACRVVEDEGFLCFPFKHVEEEHLYRIMFSRQRGSLEWKGLFQFGVTLREWLLGTIPQQVKDLEVVLAHWRPDVIVCDPTMWSPILIFHQMRRVPVAVSSFIPACLLPGPDAPPFGLGLPRPRDWCTRLLARLVALTTDVLAVNFRRAANALRQRYGLPALTTSVTAFTGQMPLYLVPSAPEFDYERRDLPPSVRYVGFCIWNKPRHEPPATWLSQLPQDQPWVHVTEGTMHVTAPLVLRAAAQGLADLPVQVIMTTGDDRDPVALDLGPIASNVRVARWVSHSDLLPYTDVVVTTGGAGTVLAALHAGVPLVIVPTEWDKPENAQRVVEAGAGLRLSPRRCTPERLRAVVERVLEEPAFCRNARRLGTVFARYGGAERAAELLEGLCVGRPVDRDVIV